MNINFLKGAGQEGMVNLPAKSGTRHNGMKGLLITMVLILGYLVVSGQANPLGRFRNPGGSSGSKDSLQHRKDDTMSITFRYLDSSRLQTIDSEVYNFYLRYPLQPTFVDFGNIGTASHNLIFSPFMQPGWDGGWHAYDPYVFTIEGSRLLQYDKTLFRAGLPAGKSCGTND